MADKLWRVEGKYSIEGKPETWDNVYNGGDKSAASKAAESDFNRHTSRYGGGKKYSKLKVTKVTEYTEADRLKHVRKMG